MRIDVKPENFDEIAKGVESQAEAMIQDAAANLAAQIYGHIVEEVNNKLKTSRETYLSALHMKQESQTLWVVELNPDANWIEEGMPRHEMVMQILRGGSPARYAKDGSMYKIIPFKFNKAPTRMNAAGREIQNIIKVEFKKAGIPYGKLEKGPDGQPLVGKLHKLDIMDRPIKTQEGVGQGLGPIGAVRQGQTGIPILKAINVIQRQMSGSTGTMQYIKDVMTFRVVSSKHVGSGRWVHPGVQPKKFFEEAYQWAQTEWNTNIKPDLVGRIMSLRAEQDEQ